jgi:hypothetical protein
MGAVFLDQGLAAGAIALLAIGAFAALAAANLIKRLAGLVICGLGAVTALAALQAPAAALTAGAAIIFAHLAIGSAIIVRAQEGFGSIETPELDAAGVEGEREERA